MNSASILSVSYNQKVFKMLVRMSLSETVKYMYCPDAEKTCSDKAKAEDLKAYFDYCCQKDNSNYYSSSATGILVATFTFTSMLLAWAFT